eukprot:416619-Pelagomonas_calceolata.AAC.1
MGGAGRALMCNFRRKYDIVNTAKGARRQVVREEEITVHFISLVGRVAGAIASTNCSIHVPNDDGSA